MCVRLCVSSLWIIGTMHQDPGWRMKDSTSWEVGNKQNCSAHSPNRVSRPWIGEGERGEAQRTQNQGDTPRFPGRTRLPECCCCLVTKPECKRLKEEGRGEQSQHQRTAWGGRGNPYSININLCNHVGKWLSTLLKCKHISSSRSSQSSF